MHPTALSSQWSVSWSLPPLSQSTLLYHVHILAHHPSWGTWALPLTPRTCSSDASRRASAVARLVLAQLRSSETHPWDPPTCGLPAWSFVPST